MSREREIIEKETAGRGAEGLMESGCGTSNVKVLIEGVTWL